MVALAMMLPEMTEPAWPIDGWLVPLPPFQPTNDDGQASISAAGDEPYAPTSDLLERLRWARERAAIDAEAMIAQAEEAGGVDPIG